MKRTLVGIDESEASRAALRWTARLAAQVETTGDQPPDVIALTAWRPAQAELPVDEAEHEHREARALLALRAAELAEPGLHIETEVIDGDVADVLLRSADERDADLVVVGSRGAGGFAGLRIGSVADHLAHHTTRPLTVVPTDAGTPTHIVVGVDDSEGAANATRWSASLASQLGASVSAVHVWTAALELLPHGDPHSVFQYIERSLNGEWIEPLRRASVPTDVELVQAPHVAEALLDVAARTNAQLIVVGTHALAPVVRLRLGGTAMRILHTSDLPVVLVAPPAH